MKPVSSNDGAKRSEPPQEWPPRPFDELTELLAEALVIDYQGRSGHTANSPQGIDHKIVSTLL